MSQSEFSLIEDYFSHLYPGTDDSSGLTGDIELGIGDDAALVRVPNNKLLAISIDTLLEGRHFPINSQGCHVAWKALAVNLSDMAAMGATPAWFTLALSLPEFDAEWLESFSKGLSKIAHRFKVPLIGGDTTRGPLSVTIQIAGYVDPGRALTRSGAKPGDYIYITGTIGDAALGLSHLLDDSSVSDLLSGEDLKSLLHRLTLPEPRIACGERLAGLASSCIDISDGFIADLQHILVQSNKGAEVELEKIPLPPVLQKLKENKTLDYSRVLSGGDDYELCFTSALPLRDVIEQVGDTAPVTCVGRITDTTQLVLLDAKGEVVQFNSKGFDHFGNNK